ncbi:hypothetical protein B0O80DRAFT_492820 [Mortierella sp. GBAus27b]|nr:hypothetical protein B0O80DRAFT_492820 [Mortierella sp. GBAus27b]
MWHGTVKSLPENALPPVNLQADFNSDEGARELIVIDFTFNLKDQTLSQQLYENLIESTRISQHRSTLLKRRYQSFLKLNFDDYWDDRLLELERKKTRSHCALVAARMSRLAQDASLYESSLGFRSYQGQQHKEISGGIGLPTTPTGSSARCFTTSTDAEDTLSNPRAKLESVYPQGQGYNDYIIAPQSVHAPVPAHPEALTGHFRADIKRIIDEFFAPGSDVTTFLDGFVRARRTYHSQQEMSLGFQPQVAPR